MILTSNSTFPYGKYEGFKIGYHFYQDFDYYMWWNKNVTKYPFSEEIQKAIQKEQSERWAREQKLYFQRVEQKYKSRGCNSVGSLKKDLYRTYDDEDGIIIGLNGF